jgi:hypothetical protein
MKEGERMEFTAHVDHQEISRSGLSSTQFDQVTVLRIILGDSGKHDKKQHTAN